MTFYRYDFIDTGEDSTNIIIVLKTFFLVKETPKGYWILENGWFFARQRWVSKTSKKRYAYPTKEQALTNFIKRKERYLRILRYKITSTKAAIKQAKSIKQKL